MTFNDRLISGTNFSNELAIKNLHILPLNQYIELKPNNFIIHEKNINYEKIPYDANSYLNLLHKAKDDILQKLKNIMNSNDISKYTMSLSGGFDRRLNLAVLLNNPEACKSIGVVTRDVETSNDLGISLWLTNYFNLSYAHYDNYNMQYHMISLKDFITHYLNFNSGMYHTIHQQHGTILKSDTGKETINIVGMFGESMRSRYYKDTHHLITNENSISQIVNKITCKLDSNRMSFIDNSFFQKYCIKK